MNKLSRVLNIIFILIALVTSTNIIHVRAATTWVVKNLSDSGLGSLRYSIENSLSGDTITFYPSLSGQTILTAGIIINHNLTIDGSSLNEHVIISGGNSNTVFWILNCINFSCTPITVSIKSVDIINGGVGGLSSRFSTTTIDRVNFHNNQNPNSWGGAIMNDGNMTITNSTFTNNSGEKGGAIFNSGFLTIANSTIANNTSENWGGGIYNENTITISNSSIYSNYAEWEGDGIYTRMGTNIANTIITQSAIYNNLGHGVFFEGSSTIGDTEDKITIVNSTITGNTGKGVMTSYGSLIVKNSTITNNTQPNEWGGGSGIYVFGDAPNRIGTITLINSIVANNTNGNDCDLENSEVLESTGNLIENNGVGDNSCGNPTVILDPILGLLQNNGGSTPTMALLPNSPAINSGNNTLCDSTDQRGLYRPQGGICDIGAYELDFQPIVSSIVRASTSPTSAASVDFTVTFSEDVTGVNTNGSDFELFTTGVTGASITGVTPVSASVYTVSVNTGSGDGIIRLDLIDDDSIEDLGGNKLGGTGTGNGAFISGETYSIFKLPPYPVSAPKLSQPRRNYITNNSSPTFSWNNVPNAVGYEIVIATDSSFSQIVLTENTSSPSFTPPNPLEDGKLFWRVRAYNSAAQPGKYSVSQIFIIDTIAPAAPLLTSPMENATLKFSPVFRWTRVPGAVLYEFQYDNDSDLSSPMYSVTTPNTYRKPPAMPNGTFFWRVRTQDAAGNWSEWAIISSIAINR